MSFMYTKIKGVGPRTEPWGTPDVTSLTCTKQMLLVQTSTKSNNSKSNC